MNTLIMMIAGYYIADADMSKKELAIIILKSLAITALICGACILLDILCH